MRILPWILVGVLSVVVAGETVALVMMSARQPSLTPEEQQALAFMRLGVKNQVGEAHLTQAKIKAKNIAAAVESYYVDHGEYPTNLDALLLKSDIGKGPYLQNRNDLLDPWGNAYQFDPKGPMNTKAGVTTRRPDVFTKTPDGRTVGNWSDGKF